MKTLHSEDFIEFSILTYIIGFYAAFSLLSALIGSRKLLYFLFAVFVLFGIVAMIDFWRWEYNYGHNLDPNAAIIVPGMAYQPPLIGFKQLLNFGAFSVPDTGGWLFIGAGLLMLTAVFKEYRSMKKVKNSNVNAVMFFLFSSIFFSSCGTKAPEPIRINQDNCDYCKMSISDKRFACELLTSKSKAFKFDDVNCLLGYTMENKEKTQNATFYVSDFLSPHDLKETDALFFIEGERVASPMGGNIAAFSVKDSAQFYAQRLNCSQLSWRDIHQ